MMSTGNELGPGQELFIQHLVEEWRARDKRHIYTATSHPFQPARNDDFYVGADAVGGPARGIDQTSPGSLTIDFERTVGSVERPFIAHEIGQYTSFPDFYSWFDEKKYTGPLKAHYIDMIRKRFATVSNIPFKKPRITGAGQRWRARAEAGERGVRPPCDVMVNITCTT